MVNIASIASVISMRVGGQVPHTRITVNSFTAKFCGMKMKGLPWYMQICTDLNPQVDTSVK